MLLSSKKYIEITKVVARKWILNNNFTKNTKTMDRIPFFALQEI